MDNYNVNPDTLEKYKLVLINMIYKLLPLREEDAEWQKYLDTIILELKGIESMYPDLMDGIVIFRLIAKLEGLKTLELESDFKQYRSTVFDCIGMIN